MVSLSSLWLPIVLAAAGVFVASALAHMVLPFHRHDFGRLPDEESIIEALRRHHIPPGDYVMPFCSGPAEMKTAEYRAKWQRGPAMVATFWKTGEMNMAPQLFQWLGFCLVVSLFAGYLASRALPPGASYLDVSQMASTTAFLGYVMAHWSDAIWYKRSKKTALKNTVDGLVYGLITGGFFGWLWPAV